MENEDAPKSIFRVLSVLKSFTPDYLELSTTEISRRVGIPKTTTHRILIALKEGRFLERSPQNRKFTIGPALYMLGNLYLSTTNLLKATEPIAKMLNDLSSEGVNVGILDKGYIVPILTEEAKYAFRIAFQMGSLLPAYASSLGKALLSEMTEAEIDSLYPEERLQPLTDKTITSKTELKLELANIRETGVSSSWEASYEGVGAIASVIRDKTGKAVAAMSIGVPIFRKNQAYVERLAKLVKMGSSLVSYRLGFVDPSNPVTDIQEIRIWWGNNLSKGNLTE